MRGVSHREGAKRSPKGRSQRPEGPRAGVWFLVRAAASPSPPARGLENAVSSPSGKI